MNIFERASRKKLRFDSSAGALSTEQLWGLGLIDLDHIARATNAKLKDVSEESFISDDPHPERGDLELRLDILRHVIAAKQQAEKAAEQRRENAARRKKLIEALDAKDDKSLTKMSRDKLVKELEALED